MSSKTKPAAKAVVVVASDTVDFVDGACRALWVGVSGDISVEMDDVGTAIVFKGVQGLIPIAVSRVNSASTNATDIVALY